MKKKGKYNQKNQQQQGKKKNFIITQQHLMDKTHMQPTEYLPLLPQDSVYPPFNSNQNTQLILRTILKQLNYILYVDFKVFWATILYNPSFKTCIHSCIQFLHRKWLNQYYNKTKQQIGQINTQTYNKVKQSLSYQYTQHLYRVVLLIYFRIVHFQQQNPQLSNLYHLKNQIIGKYILDTPRILEIIEIYGETNEDIVKIIVKQFINLSNTLYTDFIQQIIQPMISRSNKNLLLIKKTTDRQQFGIQYNYKRTIVGQLSAGQQQLKKKIMLLLQIISFYQSLKNIYNYFPSAWSEYTKFNVDIHTISQNIFIEIQQAYKIWHMHEQSAILYPLMNTILKFIVEYFVQFFEKCTSMFIDKNIKNNFKQAYMKCLDRMLEHYGKRNSLGKKAALQKKYMDLYREILKIYKIDQFLQKLYMEEIENNTYGINMEFLVDFKIAIDQLAIKMEGRPVVHMQMQEQEQQKTQADRNQEQDLQLIPIRKYSQKSQIHELNQTPQMLPRQSSTTKQLQDLQNLQIVISKRNRQDNYYQKLYKNYRAKITIQYEDQYDDLVDYEKRPMFQDNQKEQQDSSDASSGQQFNGEVQQLHLVKSNSNVNRQRGIGAQHLHQKYNRQNKAKFVPVRQAQAKAVINRQSHKFQSNTYTPKQREKTTYYTKQTKVEQNPKTQSQKTKEYNDEQCYQQCRKKIKEQKKQRQKQEVQQLKRNQGKRYENKNKTQVDEQDGEEYGRDQDRNRGGKRGGRGGNYNTNNSNRPKGSNINKKKYVAKN